MFKASEILQKMQDSYERKIQNDSKLRKIRKKLQNGADQSTAQQYAVRSGELLSETFKENITADLFDEDEPLDRDELADAMIPMMNRNYEHVVAAASAAQKYMNQEGGLGLKPIEPEFDPGAAMNIVGRMANYDTFEDAEWMLDEPIRTNSQHIADESLRENAEFQYRSGLKPKIVRTCESDACEWCQMLAGEYDIDEITGKDDPVYQRHNNCLCEITFVPGDGRTENITDQMVDIGDIDERIAKSKEEAEKWRKEQTKNKYRNVQNESAGVQVSGARITNPDSDRAKKFAESYYESIRKMRTDTIRIAKNTGYTESDINMIKNYLFLDKSYVDEDTGEKRRFDSDCRIAHSWQRLLLGENIQEHDITLIKHELYEMEIKKNNPGISHYDAHVMAASVYNYGKESDEYYGNLEKYSKK